ncbi:MAG: hypothetical protein H8E55_21670 [Pelagibacterales bacterium]|nr:hypothetical protein [Pelagibacterales bacterium]
MKIKDVYGNFYSIKDLTSFKNPIIKFHTKNGIPDNSIHEEEGYYFKVDQDFYNQLF